MKNNLLKYFNEGKVINYQLGNVFDINENEFEIYIYYNSTLICITNQSKATFYDDRIELKDVIITEDDSRLDEAYKGNKILFLKKDWK